MPYGNDSPYAWYTLTLSLHHPYCWALVKSGEHLPKNLRQAPWKREHTLLILQLSAWLQKVKAILWEEEVKVLNVPITVAQIHLKGRITGRKERDWENPFSVLDNSMRMHGESAPSLLGFQRQGFGWKQNTKNCTDGDRPVSANQNGISCSAIRQDSKNEMDLMKLIVRYNVPADNENQLYRKIWTAGQRNKGIFVKKHCICWPHSK